MPSAIDDPTSKLRVLHVRNSDLVGGPERLILGECTHAAADIAPHVASFVTRGRASPLLAEAARRGIAHTAIEQSGSFDLRVPGRVRRLIERLQPAVVVGHDYKANHVLRAALRGCALPRVAIVHGYTAENRKVRFFEHLDRRRLPEAQAVVAVSDAQVGALRAAGVAPGQLHVIPNAIDVDGVARAAAAAGGALLRDLWGVPASEVLMLALGRLSPEKGGDVLLEALARLDAKESPAWRLVFVGDGASRAGLEARAQQPDLAGRVVFAGWRDDPWACLGAADLLVLPSRREGMPLAVLEALAAGLPVIASAVGSVPAVLHDDAVGSVVPPEDPAALAAALGEFLAGRSRLGTPEARRNLVRTHYAVGPRTHSLESVYRDLVATQAAR